MNGLEKEMDRAIKEMVYFPESELRGFSMLLCNEAPGGILVIGFKQVGPAQ